MNSPADSQIYVIDDHPESLRFLEELLLSEGYSVSLHTSASTFLANYPDRGVGCVVTDFKLEGMDGLQLLQEIKQQEHRHPVIVLSAFVSIAEAVKIMRAGAYSLLQKPYDEQEFLAVVKEALEHSHLAENEFQIANDLKERFNGLTPIEILVLEKMISGVPTKAIAADLDISTRTVDRRRTTIFEKLKARSLAELVMMYVEWSQSDSAI